MNEWITRINQVATILLVIFVAWWFWLNAERARLNNEFSEVIEQNKLNNDEIKELTERAKVIMERMGE